MQRVHSPEVNDNLLRLLHIQREIVVTAPPGQAAHLAPVVCLISVADETHHSRVIRKFNEAVGVVCRCAVVGQQSEEEGAQHTSLGGTYFNLSIKNPTGCIWYVCYIWLRLNSHNLYGPNLIKRIITSTYSKVVQLPDLVKRILLTQSTQISTPLWAQLGNLQPSGAIDICAGSSTEKTSITGRNGRRS